MANYQTRDLQMRALRNLLELDRICRAHDIRYYISDGTALGAVRHGGFIPWDDDLDVVMPRPDYEVFIKHANEWLDKPYEMVCPEDDDKYAGVFAKIIDGSTTLIERWGFNQLGGVYVDIWPLDAVADSKFLRTFHFSLFKIANRLLYMRNRDPYKRGHGPSSWWPRFVQFCFKNKTLQRFIHWVQTLCNFEKHERICMLDNGEKTIITKSVIGQRKEYDFEGRKFFGPEDYDTYLSRLYGDYMKIPPENKRRIHRPDYLDLEHSYHDYHDTRKFK